MYDRNEGVKVLISTMALLEQLKGPDMDPGPYFNAVTGRITHNKKNMTKDAEWWYLTRFMYPVFDPKKNNEYIGVMTPTGYFFSKESFNCWSYP